MIMTDRELLEAAAKAAGMLGEWLDGMGWLEYPGCPRFWNPLTDDGDALRLAVKLQFNVCHYGDCVIAGHWKTPPNTDSEEWTGMIGADPYAATRRAIVRAAAAIAQSNDRSES